MFSLKRWYDRRVRRVPEYTISRIDNEHLFVDRSSLTPEERNVFDEVAKDIVESFHYKQNTNLDGRRVGDKLLQGLPDFNKDTCRTCIHNRDCHLKVEVSCAVQGPRRFFSMKVPVPGKTATKQSA